MTKNILYNIDVLGGKDLMRKLNLVLFIFALIAMSGLIMSINAVYAEDTPAVKADKDKMKYDPCSDMDCLSANSVVKTPNKMNMEKSGDMMCQMCPKMEKMGKGMGNMDMGKGMMCPMMQGKSMSQGPMDILSYADKLNLTDQQKSAIDATHLAHKKDMIRKEADLKIANIELESIANKEETDMVTISDQIKKIANMEAEIKIAQFKIGMDIKSILTKEQLNTLKMIKQHESYKAKMDEMPKAEAKPMPEHSEHKK